MIPFTHAHQVSCQDGRKESRPQGAREEAREEAREVHMPNLVDRCCYKLVRSDVLHSIFMTQDSMV